MVVGKGKMQFSILFTFSSRSSRIVSPFRNMHKTGKGRTDRLPDELQ